MIVRAALNAPGYAFAFFAGVLVADALLIGSELLAQVLDWREQWRS